MADYYFHYTSDVAAQMIIAAGQLVPGAAGVVYITDEVYAMGADAANALAIPMVGPEVATAVGVLPLTKPVTLVCVIPHTRVPGIAAAPVAPALPYRDPRNGQVLYWGGGREFRYPQSINIAGLPWLRLGSP
jgi:hypothetical protein